jgi:hypothetical protein
MDTNTPPFAPGDRIIERDCPERGSFLVWAIWCHESFGWRLTAYNDSGVWTNSPTDMFVRCPAGWREPPLAPMSLTTKALLTADHPLTDRTLIAAAARDEAPEERAARAAAYRARAAWWREMGPHFPWINTAEQAAGLDGIAEEIAP